jgi:hypothetical protein
MVLCPCISSTFLILPTHISLRLALPQSSCIFQHGLGIHSASLPGAETTWQVPKNLNPSIPIGRAESVPQATDSGNRPRPEIHFAPPIQVHISVPRRERISIIERPTPSASSVTSVTVIGHKPESGDNNDFTRPSSWAAPTLKEPS